MAFVFGGTIGRQQLPHSPPLDTDDAFRTPRTDEGTEGEKGTLRALRALRSLLESEGREGRRGKAGNDREDWKMPHISLGSLSPQQRRLLDDSERQRQILKDQLLKDMRRRSASRIDVRKRREATHQKNNASIPQSSTSLPLKQSRVHPPIATNADYALEVGLNDPTLSSDPIVTKNAGQKHLLPVLRLPTVSSLPVMKSPTASARELTERERNRREMLKEEQRRHLEAMSLALKIPFEELVELEKEVDGPCETESNSLPPPAPHSNPPPSQHEKWWNSCRGLLLENSRASASPSRRRQLAEEHDVTMKGAEVNRSTALVRVSGKKSQSSGDGNISFVSRTDRKPSDSGTGSQGRSLAPLEGADLSAKMLLPMPKMENVEILKVELERSMGQIGELTDMVVQELLGVIEMCPITNPKVQTFVKRYSAMRLFRLLGEICISMQGASFDRWLTFVRVQKRQSKMRTYLRYQGASKLVLALNRQVTSRLGMAWRAWRQLVVDFRIKEASDREVEAAIIIQRVYRIHTAKQLRRLLASIEMETRRNASATTINRIARGKLTRMRMKLIRKAILEEKAAGLLTRVGRGMLGRNEAKGRRRIRAKHFIAVAIQRLYRRQKSMSIIRAIRRARIEKEAATKIQSIFRGRKGREVGKDLVLNVKKAMAAETIQKFARSWLFRKHFALAMIENAARRAVHRRAAIEIQRTFRGHSVRNVYRARIEVHSLVLKREKVSATLIQCLIRRYLATKLVATLAKSRHIRRIRDAQAWQETWDDRTQTWMYINEGSTSSPLREPPKTGYKKFGGELVLETGEIVTDPGDQETPEEEEAKRRLTHCSECTKKRATRECEQCGDRFCSGCFARLHASGQRAKHNWSSIGPSECAECDEEPAVKHCMSCDEPFCARCWGRIHAHGRRSQHSYFSIAPDGSISSQLVSNQLEGVDQGDSYISASSADAGALVQYAQQQQYLGYPQESQWAQYYDDQGYPYWYNSETGESTYYQPEGAPYMLEADATGDVSYYKLEDASGSYNESGGTLTATDNGSSIITVDSGTLAGGGSEAWMRYEDGGGQAYWYNASTGESTYNAPDSHLQSYGSTSSAILATDSDWERVEDGGTVYFFNRVTGESQWESPFI